jgi:hypothetical protein
MARATTRGPNGQFIRTMEQAEVDAEACRLRSRRRSYQQIADELGLYDKAAAYRAVQRGLAAIPQEAAAEVLRLELEKLDQLEQAALEVLERQHVTVSHGQLVFHEGVPLVDDGPVLQAIAHILKIQERRAKLLGLDAPKRIEVLTLDAVDAEIARLTAELGRADLAAPGAPEGTARTQG